MMSYPLLLAFIVDAVILSVFTAFFIVSSSLFFILLLTKFRAGQKLIGDFLDLVFPHRH